MGHGLNLVGGKQGSNTGLLLFCKPCDFYCYARISRPHDLICFILCFTFGQYASIYGISHIIFLMPAH